MPPIADGTSPQNKIDNNVSTAINIVLLYVYTIRFFQCYNKSQ